ncbi:MAG TPA: HAD hydrolase family protein [Gemmatimonadales bacterium]|nr:HAD hydrolase family protein [Gemmatimonadales bacterium]
MTLDAALARRIRLVGFDVDGVLTDGGLYLGQVDGRPVELKRFDTQDGVAVWMLRRAGLVVALASGRASEATTVRARELQVDEVMQDDGQGRKLAAFEAMLARRRLRWEECAFVGDDLADLPLLNRVALPLAVPNAVPEVRAAAALVTRAPGGHGAAREVAEFLLRARGEWDGLLQTYLAERGDVAPTAVRPD